MEERHGWDYEKQKNTKGGKEILTVEDIMEEIDTFVKENVDLKYS